MCSDPRSSSPSMVEGLRPSSALQGKVLSICCSDRTLFNKTAQQLYKCVLLQASDWSVLLLLISIHPSIPSLFLCHYRREKKQVSGYDYVCSQRYIPWNSPHRRGLLAGYVSSLVSTAILLILYHSVIFPQSIEVVYSVLKSKGLVKSVPFGEVSVN